MTARIVWKTDYAHSQNPWGYQCPPGKITRGVEADGRAYQRHENDPGVNWNAMQRADAIENTPTALSEGMEVAYSWSQMLEPGFFAPNPGWCVVGAEVHDSRGSTQSPLELLTSQNGVTVRVFGGQISAIPPGKPTNAADKLYTGTYPFAAGVYHDCVLGLGLSGDRTKGWCCYSVDGIVRVNETCATLYTGGTGYVKLAFYRDPNQPTNKVAAVRFGNMTFYEGAGSWEAAYGVAPAVRPIHDAVAQVSATANPNIRHALDLIADKVEP